MRLKSRRTKKPSNQTLQSIGQTALLFQMYSVASVLAKAATCASLEPWLSLFSLDAGCGASCAKPMQMPILPPAHCNLCSDEIP
jgi:hypothetical protein